MPYKRKGSEIYQIRVQGRRTSSDTTDFAAADALEKKLNSAAWATEKGLSDAKPTKTWKQLREKWDHERTHKPEAIMSFWELHLGHITDIRKINREFVDGLILKHRDGVQPKVACSANTTANHYVNIVSAMMNAAAREWDWIESAPKLRRYTQPDGRDRWLTVEEWQRVIAELPHHLQRAAKFALATGLRAEKVFMLEWTQIDLKLRRLTFKGTENKLGNTIPLNDTAMSVLREILNAPARHMTRVFFWMKPKKIGDKLTATIEPLNDYGKAWWKALVRAGLGEWVTTPTGESYEGDVCWHTLRHTFTSWLGQAGVPDGVIDRLGGWSTGAKRGNTRERYKHLNVEHLRPFAAVIDRTLAGEQVQLLQVTA